MDIRYHRILFNSSANGPGRRNVVWFQGCTLNCQGCFNPLTHDPKGGRQISCTALGDLLLSHEPACEGITISGGEPFQQAEALLELLKILKARKSPPVLIFSGYSFSWIKDDPLCRSCLPFLDALICGPFMENEPPAYDRFCSSANQELILLNNCYTQSDFANLPLGEILVDGSGNAIVSGISPLPLPQTARIR